MGKAPNRCRVPLKRSAAPANAPWVRRAPDASFSLRVGVGGCEAGSEPELTDCTSEAGLAPEDSSEPLGEDSPGVLPSPVVALVVGRGDGDPGFWAESGPIGIEVGVNPAAGRSPSNPEPARLSPPTDDIADQAGDGDPGAECDVPPTAELGTPLPGACAPLPPLDMTFTVGTEAGPAPDAPAGGLGCRGPPFEDGPGGGLDGGGTRSTAEW